MQVGEVDRADTVLAGAIEEARAVGDRGLEWHARVQRSHWQLYTQSEQRNPVDILSEAEQAIAAFGELGDDLGVARGWALASDARAFSGQAAKAGEAAERAAEHARLAGSRREEAWGLEVLTWITLFGPTPVVEETRRWEKLLEQAQGALGLEALTLRNLTMLGALQGRFAEAREQMTAETMAELGLKWFAGWGAVIDAYIEMLADDPVAAERHLRAAHELSSDAGDAWLTAFASVDLARALYEQSRYEEAVQLTERFEPALPDLAARVKWQGIRAKLAARQEELDRAEALAREAVSLAEQTDWVLFRADALLDLAEVLRLAGRPEEAAAAAEEAVRLYERKGNVVAAARTQTLVAELRGQAPTRP